MADFGDVSQVEAALQGMIAKEWVVQLPREAGKRESRFAHLFSGPVDIAEPVQSVAASGDKERIRELEHEVMILKAEVDRLRQELGQTH